MKRNTKKNTRADFTTRVLLTMAPELIDLQAALRSVVAQYDALAKVRGLQGVSGVADPLL
jgi:hypothetical protein